MNRTIMLATCLAMFGLVATAEAHFRLSSPAASLQQNSLGDPQKTAPCGGAGTPTNAVTDVRSGAMLPISIVETIGHPGHYRVAVAQDLAGLPPAPTVADNNCNGLIPSSNPTLPVLADGLFMHTTSANGVAATLEVMIPAGMTCTNCVLQVLEYMANHGQPCFYYHCAMVNISPDGPQPQPPDAGVPGGDAGVDPTDPGGGCCSAGRDSAVTGLLGVLAVGLLLRRRRRR